MSLLTLPSEIFQQFLSETVLHESFAALRLVHPVFNDNIQASADLLMRQLLRAHNVSEHVLSLHQGDERDRSKLHSLLRLHKEVATCIRLEQVLDTHREKFVPIWADVPAKGFGSIEAVLVFSAFQHQLQKVTTRVLETDEFEVSVARANSTNDCFEWLKLDHRFRHFVRHELMIDDLQTLITIVNFCAVSTRFADTIMTSRYFFSDAGASDHWQNEQLGSALLAERILWRGPSWLAKVLHQNMDASAPAILLEQRVPADGEEDHTMWAGSQADAVRLTANGLARFLWNERAQRLKLARQAAETAGLESKRVARELRVDPAVWRGSSGGY